MNLNERVVELPEGVNLLSAADINESGQIVGTAQTADGNRGFVLTPVTEEPEPEPEPKAVETSISATVATQRYGRTAQLKITVAPKATGKVTAAVGSRLVTGALVSGKATLKLPAKALKPGRHAVKITYSGVADRFAASQGSVTVTVKKAIAKVTAKRSKARVKTGNTAKFTVAVKSTGVTPGGKVTVKVAGKSKTVKLGKRGTTTVKVKIPKSKKAGVRKVSVTYHGSSTVSSAKSATKIRITR
ncbi:Ig-like domain repeat protein [Leucobacter soli]|uniref:Ig-like domain repeat protein n=1 Tax=Leucobacter soli TaxID=2812850 RepID=UPI003606284A